MATDNNGSVRVSSIGQGTFPLKTDDVRELTPFVSGSAPAQPLGIIPAIVISIAETADHKIWLGTLGTGLFSLSGGQGTRVSGGLPDRKINCLVPIGEEVWVGTDTGLYHGNGNGFRRVPLPSLLAIVTVFCTLPDHDSNSCVGPTRWLLPLNPE